MSTISHYYTDTGDGTVEYGPYDDYAEARREAERTNGRVIEYEYEFSDSSLIDDYTENTAYVVDEYMLMDAYVARIDRAECRHCGETFAFEDDETHGGLCRGCDATLPAGHPNRGENR